MQSMGGNSCVLRRHFRRQGSTRQPGEKACEPSGNVDERHSCRLAPQPAGQARLSCRQSARGQVCGRGHSNQSVAASTPVLSPVRLPTLTPRETFAYGWRAGRASSGGSSRTGTRCTIGVSCQRRRRPETVKAGSSRRCKKGNMACDRLSGLRVETQINRCIRAAIPRSEEVVCAVKLPDDGKGP